MQVVYFLMSEDNVRRQVALPWMSFGSDAGAQAPEGVFLQSSTHPRAYGNFARLLGKYVREEKVITLPEAVRRMTSLPARNLGLRERGLLKPGYYADVVIFDPQTVGDPANFAEPHAYAAGETYLPDGMPEPGWYQPVPRGVESKVADKLAFLVDGFVGGPGMITTARRQYPGQYLHYHRAGHGMITSPSAKRGYTAFVLAKISRLQGASGIHVGTMGYGKMEGENSDKNIAYMIERDEAQGPVYYQKWYGMKPTTPIISGGMNALRLPGFFENLGHGNVINTSGGGAYGHIDSPAAGAISLRQSYECWKSGADPIAYAKEHKEFARAFASFPGDADKLYPGWREKLGSHK